MKKNLLFFIILVLLFSTSACQSSDNSKKESAQSAFDAKQKEYEESSKAVKNDHESPVVTSTMAQAEYDVSESIDYDRLKLSLTAEDNVDGNLTSSIVQKDSNVKEGTVGSYQITYSVIDNAGNEGTFTLPVIIRDKKIESLHILYEGDSCNIEGIKVKAKKIDDNYHVKNDEDDYYSPKEGYKYVAVTIKIRNDSDNSIDISDSDFNCYADSKEQDSAYLPESESVYATLKKGSEKTFNVFYEVPSKAKSISIETKEDSWNKEPIAILIESKPKATGKKTADKKKNKKTREDYTTDKNYDWYIRNAKEGDPFSFTMNVIQKIDDNTYLCDVNTDYTSDMVFVYIDKDNYTKEVTGGKKIIEDDIIRVYGEFLETYIYTTAIGGSKEALKVKAIYVDIQK